jgi:hypothetical protein
MGLVTRRYIAYVIAYEFLERNKMRGSGGETLATIPLPENIVCCVQSRLPPFVSICPALKTPNCGVNCF